jgi:ribonucleoside-diphosphate reductase alpha chain
MVSNSKKVQEAAITLKKVKKRDGSLDNFDPHKIALAIERCFKNGLQSTDEEAQTAGIKVSKAVVNIFNKKTEGETVEVESLQRLVIQQLWALGYFDAAEQYTLFKEKRRQERVDHPVDPALRKMVDEDNKYFPTALQYYQFVSKFSKWNDELGRRETWGECVDRVIGFFEKNEFYGKLSKDDKKDLKEYLHKMDATPAMRVIQMAGGALDRCHVGVYNCSYMPISDIKSFSELLYILMQGTGAGFSVEKQYVNQLPAVKRQNGKAAKKLTIVDDTEGWCDALTSGLEAWFNGDDIEFDYSKIRPSGTRLKTKGGRASGPGPLMELMSFAKNLILSRQGRSLSDLDCHDLACKVGKIVQVGGVRRASEISLSDLDSVEMRNAKTGTWWNNNLQRTMANNSAVYAKKPSTIEFVEEWLSLAKSGSGERGIFNREGVNASLPKRRKPNTFGTNPCAEIILRPYQFCNLSIVVAREDDTPETLAKKVRIATIFGTMQSCLTDFKYIRKEWKDNCEEERLLGVDITGQMDCPILRPGSPGREKLLENLKAVVGKTNEEYAKKFGIPRSTANTCVKPSGDSAVMFGCSSGIHARFSEYYIRRVRERADSPIAHMLIDAGVPWIVAPEDPSLVAFEFPCASPKGAIIKTQQTAIDQLDNWLTWKRHWAEHSVSATVYMEQDEWLAAGKWVWDNFDEISGISFLPRDNGTYTGTPYEEIDAKEYSERLQAFPKVDWAKLSRYEKTDHTESAQTYACTSGVCEL